jgi:uncharacterized protein (UPF0297 family)
MTDKVKLPREVAEALDSLREKGYSNFTILSYVINEKYIAHLPEITTIVKAYERDDFSFDKLLNALVNGYEIEKSPEEKVREYYESLDKRPLCSEAYGWHEAKAIKKTLDLLGIKIPGVNADA